jgi:hypothetical protein
VTEYFPYRHPGLGFELAVPAPFTGVSELPPVLRLGGEGEGGFAPTLAVTAQMLDPDLDLDRWVDGSVPELAAWLAGVRELDREPVHTRAGATSDYDRMARHLPLRRRELPARQCGES